MTVANNVDRNQYTATGGQTVFSYTFETTAAANLLVYQRAAGSQPDDTADLLVNGVDYTVTGVGNENGGTIILSVGATVGDIITIQSGMPVERDTSFTPNGLIRAEDLNIEFDNQTLIEQKLQTIIEKLIPKYPNSAFVQTRDLVLPVLGNNQIWMMDTDVNEIQAVTYSSGESVAALKAELASHDAGEGASLVGLEGLGTVQDLANATFLLQSASPFVPNSFVLAAGSGVTLTPGAGVLTISSTGGTVTNITAGTGIIVTPSPITGTGSVALIVPVSVTLGGTGLTSTVANQLLYSSANNVISGLATANNGVLVTSAGGVPSISSVLPGGLTTTDPTLAQGIATKNYVDQNALSGTSVYAATINTSMNATQAGAGVGATLTDASGTFAALSLDGVAIPLNSDVLVKNTGTGVTAANEGIYKLTTNGNGVNIPWQLTRSVEYDTPEQINNTGLIIVQNGSTLAGTAWYNTATIVTVDTTNFNFVQFGVDTSTFVRAVKIQVFDISGAATYTPSSGMINCIVECVGGGGGGGGVGDTSGGNAAASGGGGAGGYCRKLFTAAEIGATAAITVGALGAGGAAGFNNGTAGTATTFNPAGSGVTLTANGGGGGVAGSADTNVGIDGTGGGGADGLNGDINLVGASGANGYIWGVTLSQHVQGGNGGASIYGFPGSSSINSAGGSAATAGYGGGGGGASGVNTATTRAGGNGADGLVLVLEFCNQF